MHADGVLFALVIRASPGFVYLVVQGVCYVGFLQSMP